MFRRFSANFPSPLNFNGRFLKSSVTRIPSQFFTTPPQKKSVIDPCYVSPYVLGPVITPAYVKQRQIDLEATKNQMKYLLDCREKNLKDLATVVDLLFDFEKSAAIIQKIDAQLQKMVAIVDPNLFAYYEAVIQVGFPEQQTAFLKDRFLPHLRKVFKMLAVQYDFDPTLIETHDGILLDDDYMEFVTQGKLILDLGEDGHGPFPHLIVAFMMKAWEKEGWLGSALTLYQSLSEKTKFYCPYRADYVSRFYLLLDFPNAYPLTTTLFCNPASLANHLLFHGKALKPIASICKKHSRALAHFSKVESKPHSTRSY